MSPAERQSLIERRAELHYEIARMRIKMRPMKRELDGFQNELEEIEALFLAEINT
ncbi:MAG TPA: hypothetical protein VMS08_00995 [Candidatus Saccharimonadia bacterium]|nr:hypothetical protein [Candidatus Saccharimonadia bacterium]